MFIAHVGFLYNQHILLQLLRVKLVINIKLLENVMASCYCHCYYYNYCCNTTTITFDFFCSQDFMQYVSK